MVARPGALSLAEIKAFPSRSQITHQACEEGWCFIAEWTGAVLSDVLQHVGIDPKARFVGDGLGSSAPATGYSWYAGV